MKHDRLNVIRQIAVDAGRAILQSSPTTGIQQKEGRGNFVTAADLESEKLIIERIQTHFPEDAILSEETASPIKDPLAEERLWIVDPIDGTHNFRYGRNYSAVSIGYAENCELKMGAIYDIYRDDLYWAEKNKGAFCNKTKLQVSSKDSFDDITLITDNSYEPEETRKTLQLLSKLKPIPFIIMNGSAAMELCEIAAGKADLFYHTVLQPWDTAAGFLMITEAGGTIKKINGETATFMDQKMVAGNEKLIGLFIKQASAI